MATKEKASGNSAGRSTTSRAQKADDKATTKTAGKSTKTAQKAGPKTRSSAKKDADGPKQTKAKKKEDNYTDPELRERLKEKIMAGDKGGKPGQWSARKAQLLKAEYEKEGGGYKSSKRTESQKSLAKWTDEEWTTSDGKPAEREGGTTRYLPKEAWDKLSPEEKKKTNVKKQAGSRAGQQHVANTDKAKKARKTASKE